MLKFLLGFSALWAMFQIGREFGRAEAEVMLSPPVDYDRHRSTKSDAEHGDPT